MSKTYLILFSVFISVIAKSTFADEKTSNLTQLAATGTDIANVAGLDVYKFRVPLKSKTFAVVVTEQTRPNGEVKTLSEIDFALDVDSETFEILLSFLPTDGTMRNALLLSKEDRVDFSVFCEVNGTSTMSRVEIERPLSSSSTLPRSVTPMTLKAHDGFSSDGTLCLLAIRGKHQRGKPSPEKDFPIAKVCIVYK